MWDPAFKLDAVPCPCAKYRNKFPDRRFSSGHVAAGLDEFEAMVPGCGSITSASAASTFFPGRAHWMTKSRALFDQHEFMLSERQLQAQFRADLEAHRLRAEALACQQQAKIEALELDVKSTTKKLELKQKQVKESFALSTRVRQNFFARLAFERAFRSWQAHAVQMKEEQLQNKLASYQQGQRLVAALFTSWRQDVQSGSRERLIAHERAAAGAVRAKLFEQMENERAQLLSQVEELKRQLSEEGKQSPGCLGKSCITISWKRALLQDNLKRVFMRGVCALNFEAMSLLSDPGAGGSVLSGAPGAATMEGLLASEPASAEPVALPCGANASCHGAPAATQALPAQDLQHRF
eukprot:s2476_g8.t1